MPPLRHHQIEHEILQRVLQHSDHQGYPIQLAVLAGSFPQALGHIENRELVDTFKRLRPEYLSLWKPSADHGRFIEYPTDIADDDDFFYRGDFRARPTPGTGPRVQELASMNAEEAEQRDRQRRARFEQLERLGLEIVEQDLANGGGRWVGGNAAQLQEALEWVRLKKSQQQAGAAPERRQEPAGPLFIAESRIDELRQLSSKQFDFRKLVRLCEEINIVYREECCFATAMLTRGLLDHVPPLFGHSAFGQVASNYGGGGKSFKEAMEHLQGATKKIADGHLHTQIRKTETLPTRQQISCSPQVDLLLGEIVRIMR